MKYPFGSVQIEDKGVIQAILTVGIDGIEYRVIFMQTIR